MAAKPRVALDPVADLSRRVASGPVLSPAALRAAVLHWWVEQGLAEHSAMVGKRIALALLEQRAMAAKRAGLIVLHELLADHLRASDLGAFEPLFAAGAFTDAELVDWLGVKVLGTMLLRVRGRGEVARVLATWRNAETVAQRRAACVAFTVIAPQGDAALDGLAQLIFSMCSTVVWSPERLDQTAVSWLLRELSRAEPTRVEAFYRRHARFMSPHCARQAIEKLPALRQRELLAHWKRATSVSR
jgi:3-methyladenine DNA glycosylase AlkD